MWHHQPSFLLDYRLNMLALNALSNAQLFNMSTYSKAANILVFIILIKTLLERIFQDAIYHIFLLCLFTTYITAISAGEGELLGKKKPNTTQAKMPTKNRKKIRITVKPLQSSV